jgi:DNA-sulfur modification-associated
MEFKELNPAEGIIVTGSVVDDHTFLSSVPTGQLLLFTTDPRQTEDKNARATNPAMQAMFEVRRDVQRLFEGEKEKNVDPYSDYLIQVYLAKENGEVPSIILWTDAVLKTELLKTPLGGVLIPFSLKLIAIDGETQLAARYVANLKNPDILGAPATIKICHGRSVEWAKQAFHDLNVLGVQPNAAVALAMDLRDPLTAVAREVETVVPFFKGRISKDRRQLRKRDDSVLTITALRGGVVTLSEGITGVKYGTGPVPVHSARLPEIKVVALEWFTAITQALGSHMEDRQNKVAGTPPALAAMGAMAHELLNYANDPVGRKQKQDELIGRLRQIDWTKGKAWEGIAGKFTPKGAFSVGGTKETVYSVFKALSEPTSPEGRRVRPTEQSSPAFESGAQWGVA